MVTGIFVYIHLCYFSHEGTLSQIESNLSRLRKKASIMNLLLALSTKQHCTLSKGNFSFFPLLLFPCFSVELVCISCSVTQKCFWLKKKKLSNKCWSKFFLSVCTATVLWVYMGVSSWWIAAESQRLVFMQSNNVCWFACISRFWNDAHDRGCVVWLLPSWVASCLLSLCVVWLVHELK